jgi:hypothetical protein
MQGFCDGLHNLVEVSVKRKVVSCVLVASLSFSIGCYGTGTVTKDELKAKDEQVDITVFTKDSLEYRFSKENYHIHGDTLTGIGVQLIGDGRTEGRFDGSISFADIASIEMSELSIGKTILLSVGIIGVVGGGLFLIFLASSLSGR